MKRATLLISAILLAACTQNTQGQGFLSDGQLIQADFELSSNKLYVERYVLTLPQQVECETAPKPKEWRSGQRSFPMTCSDGRTGTASFKIVIGMGGSSTTTITFRLNDGTSGIANFQDGWTI